jgi:hypothetical protein
MGDQRIDREGGNGMSDPNRKVGPESYAGLVQAHADVVEMIIEMKNKRETTDDEEFARDLGVALEELEQSRITMELAMLKYGPGPENHFPTT